MPYANKDKQREYQRLYVARNRAEWLAEHGPCVTCGSWEQLEVDHIDRSTKVSHNVWSWSELRRREELSKCQVLCHDCHRDKSNAELQKPYTHGTHGSGYARGCRCNACTLAHAVYNAAHRAGGWSVSDLGS